MRLLTTIASLLAFVTSAFALDVGAPAPSLKNVTWVKGQGVTTSGKITVVEFWATWCGPCIKTIPHLTELQKNMAIKFKSPDSVMKINQPLCRLSKRWAKKWTTTLA
jgi:thiol-disulfide isomerase/thioredoxin